MEKDDLIVQIHGSGTGDTARNFTAGVDIKSGVVIKTAPILSYMHGWTYSRVKAYVVKRHWSLTEIRMK